MKFRRSERLIDMTNYLLDHPRQLVPLTFLLIVMHLPNHPLVKIWRLSKRRLKKEELEQSKLCLGHLEG
jgi:hypothetical protein